MRADINVLINWETVNKFDIGSECYVVIYEYVYKVRINKYNIYNIVANGVEIKILEADKGPNNYNVGDYVVVPFTTIAYKTKEDAKSYAVAYSKHKLNSDELTTHYHELQNELKILENKIKHFNDVIKLYN